jgi:hypothetical protein
VAEAEEQGGITFWAIFFTVGGVLVGAVFSATLETMEQTLLVGKEEVWDKPAEIFAVQFELLLAAFGILYSAETVTPTELAGPLAHSYRWLIIAAVFAYACILIAGLVSDASVVYWLFRVVLPNMAAIVILVHAALAAQRVERSVRNNVDL